MQRSFITLSNLCNKSNNFILLSGGIDSSVLLAYKRYSDAIFFNYSQRGFNMEYEACKRLSNEYSCKLHVLNLKDLGYTFQQINKLHVPLPNRNLIFLSIASSFISSYTNNSKSSLSIGINKDDLIKDYSTAKLNFINKFKDILFLLQPEIEFNTPFINKTKSEIVLLGKELNIDFGSCYSCMKQQITNDNTNTKNQPLLHCGTCMQCKDRKKTFEELHINDSCEYRN